MATRIALCLLTLPLLAQEDPAASRLAKERALGEHVAAEVLRDARPVDDAAVQTYVERVGRRLLQGVPADGAEYRFQAIAGGNWTEPLTVPGGTVFIPAETLARVRDEHELAGTLAHALAHAALRHAIPPAGPAQNTASPSIRFLFVCGWAAWHGDARQARLLVPAKLQDVQRAYELEADRFALGLMARAGYDPSALLRYVERVDSAQSDGPTDPERAARVSAIRETIPTLATAERSVSGDLAGVQERVRPALEQRRRPPSLRRPGR